MMLLERIVTYGLLVLTFVTYVMAQCDWLNENPINQRYCRSDTEPYWLKCISTVNYNLPKCLDREDNEIYGYNIAISLQNPDENPFLANISYYTDLTIQDGYLVTVPKDIFHMTKLTNLKISENKLRIINFNNFLPLPNLKRINLGNNKIILIATVEKSSGYSTVQDIDISFNVIETVPNNFIRRFGELEHLNMSHNLITSIGKHAFEGTVQLKTLDLSYNKLQEVGTIFAQLPRLIDLDDATSKNLQKLSKLVLDDNFIVTINFTEFFDTGIPEITVGGNQIPCNELARVKYSKFSEKFNRIVTSNILNLYPENINGISCLVANNEIRDVINVSDNSNSSILISLLKTTIENNSKSIDSLYDIVNRNEKKLEQFMASTNYMLSNITDQLTDIKNNLPGKPNVDYITESSNPPPDDFRSDT